MSCVISTCMACIGGELASLAPMSPSGAPTRAMPPVGSSDVPMVSVLVFDLAEKRIEVSSSHPVAVKGSNAWREHRGTEQSASSAAVRGGCPSGRPLAFGEAFEDSRSDGETNKGLAARRTVRHGQTVIARWSRDPASKRARVSRYAAETIGCPKQIQGRRNESIVTVRRHCTRREARSRVRSGGSVLPERGGRVGPACMPQRAVVPNKGGRGIERLRLFWLPNPPAARIQGTSCYINLAPAARHYHFAPASPHSIY
ncbi:hypothetical protein FB567DRAFT_550083 [Paraphoma chrysanthemicola]|uniref:Uncharacterized protein n=1 Tax=Paraphoma chrysanthemicola TaxID=798071 RepID=A0A8K0VXP3_9PLEO|nr:hypothetical protein FB567DRAFT_550083 [Paraphoma chrysanthemicola]